MENQDKIEVIKTILDSESSKLPSDLGAVPTMRICGVFAEDFHPSIREIAVNRCSSRIENYLEALEDALGIEWMAADSDIEIDGMEFRVLTEDEREEAFTEACEQYADECLIPDLPASCSQYFDYEAFRHDCTFDGYGHVLNHYDGNELEAKTTDGNWVYIYRVC